MGCWGLGSGDRGGRAMGGQGLGEKDVLCLRTSQVAVEGGDEVHESCLLSVGEVGLLCGELYLV